MMTATSGAMMMAASPAIAPMAPLLLRRPSDPQKAMRAKNDMAAPIVAAIDPMRMSLFFTCDNS